MNLFQLSCALLPGLMAWASCHSEWPVPMLNILYITAFLSPKPQLYELTRRSSTPSHLVLTYGKGGGKRSHLMFPTASRSSQQFHG